MIILIPIIVTVLAIIYIVSPVDFLPELVLGPIGLADDAVAILIAIGVWLVYFAFPLLKILSYLLVAAGILFGLGYLIFILYKKAYGNKKIKFRLRK